jgi:anti-sigma factor RsiW
MKCFRFDVTTNLSRYAHGELSTRVVMRVENHLLDCGECRSTLARLRDANDLLKQVRRAESKVDNWIAIESRVSGGPTVSAPASWRSRRWHRLGLAPALTVGSIVIAAILFGAALVISQLRDSGHKRPLSVDSGEFHPVRIADIEHSTMPHVVAEGFVSEVRLNDEDGDLSFKLVEQPNAAEPFIICEIIDPIKLEPPQVGSKVRVYGVSRFDNKENHNWYEVHPVLSIEVVPR